MFCNDIMITLVADAKLRWNAKRGCHPTSACATPISGASNRESGFFVGGLSIQQCLIVLGLSIHQWTIHQCLIGQSSAMQFNRSSYLHLVFPGLLAKDSIEQLKYLIGKGGWVLRAKRLLISTNIFPRGLIAGSFDNFFWNTSEISFLSGPSTDWLLVMNMHWITWITRT